MKPRNEGSPRPRWSSRYKVMWEQQEEDGIRWRQRYFGKAEDAELYLQYIRQVDRNAYAVHI